MQEMRESGEFLLCQPVRWLLVLRVVARVRLSSLMILQDLARRWIGKNIVGGPSPST